MFNGGIQTSTRVPIAFEQGDLPARLGSHLDAACF